MHYITSDRVRLDVNPIDGSLRSFRDPFDRDIHLGENNSISLESCGLEIGVAIAETFFRNGFQGFLREREMEKARFIARVNTNTWLAKCHKVPV